MGAHAIEYKNGRAFAHGARRRFTDVMPVVRPLTGAPFNLQPGFRDGRPKGARHRGDLIRRALRRLVRDLQSGQGCLHCLPARSGLLVSSANRRPARGVGRTEKEDYCWYTEQHPQSLRMRSRCSFEWENAL